MGATLGCLAGTCAGTVVATTSVFARLGLRVPVSSMVGVAIATAIKGAALHVAPLPANFHSLVLQVVGGALICAAGILALFPEMRRFARLRFDFPSILRRPVPDAGARTSELARAGLGRPGLGRGARAG